MMELLKNELERKLGVEVKSRGECQLLSDAILLELGETLNYNTLRRFFFIDKKSQVKPSRNTLDLLSNFLGYNTFNQFQKQIVRLGTSQFQDDWFDIVNKDDAEIIISYLKAKRFDSFFTELFIRSIRELILMRRIQIVDLIFSSSSLRFEEFSYSETVYIGNAIGILLRNVELSEKEYSILVQNKGFVRSVFSIFVDYTSMNKGYGKVIELANRSSKDLNNHDDLFFRCLSILRSHLNNENIKYNFDIDISTFEGHPILVGRVAALQMLNCDVNEKMKIFNKLNKRFDGDKIRRIDYFYEVNIITLITRDFRLMQVLDVAQKGPHIRQQYQISHNQLGCLVRLMLAVKNDQKELGVNLLEDIKEELWVASYSSFFELFNQIALFHLTQNVTKKRAFKAKYLSLANLLEYKKFNENFLESYFD